MGRAGSHLPQPCHQTGAAAVTGRAVEGIAAQAQFGVTGEQTEIVGEGGQTAPVDRIGPVVVIVLFLGGMGTGQHGVEGSARTEPLQSLLRTDPGIGEPSGEQSRLGVCCRCFRLARHGTHRIGRCAVVHVSPPLVNRPIRHRQRVTIACVPAAGQPTTQGRSSRSEPGWWCGNLYEAAGGSGGGAGRVGCENASDGDQEDRIAQPGRVR